MSIHQEIERLSRIRRATAEHHQRRGLYVAALGLLVGYFAFGPADGRDLSIIPLLLFVVMLAAVARHYRTHYGTVVPRRDRSRLWSWLAAPLYVLGVLVTMTAANVAGLAGYLTGGLLFACLLALLSGARWRERGHYLISAAVLAALTLAPLGVLTASGDHPFSQRDPILLLLAAGVLLFVVGLIDHRALARSLPAQAEERA